MPVLKATNMTFAFYLKDKNKKEGTPLVLIISHSNRKYKKQIGISVRPSDFKKQRVKDESVNERLKIIENALNERLNQFSTPEQIDSAIDEALALSRGESTEKKKESPVRPTFWEHFKIWADSRPTSKKDRNLAYKRVSDIMGTADDWDGITEAWCYRFTKKCDDLKYSENYKATLIAKVKSVLIEGYKLGYHSSLEYKKFKYKWETADTIALSQSEVDTLWNAELDGRKAMARDLFILGVYTASRFQTYSQLSTDNIADGMIHFVQKKTGGSVIIPCSPKVTEILGRNGGHAPDMTGQEMGRLIKLICKDLGGSFLDTYQVRKREGGAIVVEKKKKWQMVSAHTARRTGATILHLAGVPDYQLMQITGHTTLANFQKYLRVTKEENARILADNPFFK